MSCEAPWVLGGHLLLPGISSVSFPSIAVPLQSSDSYVSIRCQMQVVPNPSAICLPDRDLAHLSRYPRSLLQSVALVVCRWCPTPQAMAIICLSQSIFSIASNAGGAQPLRHLPVGLTCPSNSYLDNHRMFYSNVIGSSDCLQVVPNPSAIFLSDRDLAPNVSSAVAGGGPQGGECVQRGWRVAGVSWLATGRRVHVPAANKPRASSSLPPHAPLPARSRAGGHAAITAGGAGPLLAGALQPLLWNVEISRCVAR